MQRFIKKPSAPNISGTSVRTVEPPRWPSISEKRPMVGLAVMPDRPSEPPHFMPTTSSDTGMGSRWNWRAYSASSSSSLRAAANSSSTSWQTRNLTRSGSYSPSSALNWSGWMFSQPRCSTSTPAALGWRTRAASSLRVWAWSWPVWLHPKGCGKVYRPSMLPVTRSWLSCTIFLAFSLTQPTTGMIQISLRMAARPSLRR